MIPSQLPPIADLDITESDHVEPDPVDQLAACEDILARHQRTGPSCACHRPWPCPIAESVQVKRDRLRQTAALRDATMELPRYIAPWRTNQIAPVRHIRRAWPRRLWRRLGRRTTGTRPCSPPPSDSASRKPATSATPFEKPAARKETS